MSQPYADPTDPSSGETTIPMVPDGGYAEPTVQPFADHTLVDPIGTDLWSAPQVAPAPQPTYAQPAYSQPPYAEPSGPATALPTPPPYAPYAQSPYGGQQLQPVISDPVAYDYGYNRSVPLPAHPNSVPALVLGVLSITVMSLLGPFAWYLGAKARRETAAQPGRWQSSGTATAGMILGIIGSVITALVVVFLLFLIVMYMAATAG